MRPSEWLQDVLLRMLGQRCRSTTGARMVKACCSSRRTENLFQTDERGLPELRLGNLLEESIGAILAGPAHEASLRRTEEKTARYCHSCRHYGFCNGYPVHAEPVAVAPSEGCPVTAAVHDHIERYLISAGYEEKGLVQLARSSDPQRARAA